jgi:hypothetical protein
MFKIFILLVFMCGFIVPSLSGNVPRNALDSRRDLVLLDSEKTIDASEYFSNNNLGDTLQNQLHGVFNAVYQQDDKLVKLGFITGPNKAVNASVPALINYKVVGDDLQETGRINIPFNVAQANGVSSSNQDRPYGVASFYRDILGSGNPFLPQIFEVNFYCHDEDGVYDSTPSLSYNLLQADSQNLYNATAAYSGLLELSPDGKYAVLTWSTALNQPNNVTVPGVGVVTLPQTLDKTVLAVFEVQFDSDGCPVGLVELDRVFAPDTGIPGVFAFGAYIANLLAGRAGDKSWAQVIPEIGKNLNLV